jgi:S-DNA-T family DNA segregation ATPase FtsK/SpoIIIE
MVLPMFLGKDASGEPLVSDLARMPHMLIAGTTGSGKSVCMNSIIMSWLYTKRPDELKLILVDPKMVELSLFQDIPHLMCPVVTETSKAAAILEWAVRRMEERYELLREARVRNIAAYNRLEDDDLYERMSASSDADQARVPTTLPHIVFIIDELADLIMQHGEVERSIVRIAQKARAVGIHLMFATQRPQANVVTGLIKSNMPCRISFQVASGMDSRIVLDQKGAELLLGQGDMLFMTPHTTELRRAQGTLVTDHEIRKVTKFLSDIAKPSFEQSLLTIRPAGEGEGMEPAERDPLFDEAVGLMIETGRGSVSLLQRRLGVGYSRASRLVDQMGLAGILGEHKGSVAREVLITLEEWEQMKAMEEAAEASGTLFTADGDGDELEAEAEVGPEVDPADEEDDEYEDGDEDGGGDDDGYEDEEEDGDEDDVPVVETPRKRVTAKSARKGR